jgi:hypothetical protein
MFVIQMLDGDEIHATEGDELIINPDSGVLTVHQAGGFRGATTHFSPAAWRSVTHSAENITTPASALSGAGAGRARQDMPAFGG